MKVAITTLGCKVNQYDSGVLESLLRARGCEVVPFGPGADAYIINTCSVTDRADAESRRVARRARRFGPSARVVMTGCFAQTQPQTAAIPEVDYVVGLNRAADVVAAASGALDASRGAILVDDLRKADRITTLGAETFCGQTRAFLKVQEGCDLFCTFCIVPFARGRSRSVSPRTVLAEMERLAAQGYQEIVLTGIHLGGYGEDLEPRIDLADLIEMIAEQAPVPRIRLSSIDPPEITPRLLDIVANHPALCPHFHVPIQAGDNRVLQRMRRRYSAELAREVVESIVARLPNAGIGTDVIAGFPGETDEEFARTEAFIRELPFTYLHVFPYSKRRGTTAAKIAGHLPATVIAERARRLRALDAVKRSDFAASLVGGTVEVLLESDASGEGQEGYARNYARVRLPAVEGPANRVVTARITARGDGCMLGEVVAAP